MGLITFNGSGMVQVTPDASAALAITVNGVTYSEAWDTDAATTIDNFITSFQSSLSESADILAQDGTTTLNLFGTLTDVLSVGGATAAGASPSTADQFSVPVEMIALMEPTSATALVITLNGDAPSGSDVITLTFASASELERGHAQLLKAVTQLNRANVSAVKAPAFSVASKA